MTASSGMSPFRIALAQLNPVVGDIAGNLARARAARVNCKIEFHNGTYGDAEPALSS